MKNIVAEKVDLALVYALALVQSSEIICGDAKPRYAERRRGFKSNWLSFSLWQERHCCLKDSVLKKFKLNFALANCCYCTIIKN